MVPVVEGPLHKDEWVEGDALDALLPERLHIVPGVSRDTAQVIIEHPHNHPLGGFPGHDLHHRVPHGPALDDEVLCKDGLFRFLQFCEHGGEQLIPQEVVLGRAVGIDREAGGVLDIPEGQNHQEPHDLKQDSRRIVKTRRIIFFISYPFLRSGGPMSKA